MVWLLALFIIMCKVGIVLYNIFRTYLSEIVV